MIFNYIFSNVENDQSCHTGVNPDLIFTGIEKQAPNDMDYHAYFGRIVGSHGF